MSLLPARQNAAASPQQKQDLAAFIHPAAQVPASVLLHRGFQMMAGRALRRSSRRGISLPRSKCDEAAVLRLAANGRN